MQQSDQNIYSVSELNAQARLVMEQCFNSIWVSGEISNCMRPASGHLYFSLKDEQAQIRCAFFRNQQRGLAFKPDNGQLVLIKASVSIYEARGDYQLIVQSMQAAGEGLLQIAFAKLKAKLEAEGLFDASHKKPIPLLPKTIGVITSATGAAVKDVLKVLKRRFSGIDVIIYPTLVQGNEAAAQIVSAINLANQRQECDVLIVCRGGGSLEDLWPFNAENVARAIYHSKLPIVSGIGHEVDFTIADFVADLRAATPSAAAETVSPSAKDWLKQLDYWQKNLAAQLARLIRQYQTALLNLQKRLRHPQQLLQQQAQKLDYLEQQLQRAIHNKLEKKQLRLQALSAQLNTLSPLNTLTRGFAIVRQNQTVITNSNQLQCGENVSARLAHGEFKAKVILID